MLQIIIIVKKNNNLKIELMQGHAHRVRGSVFANKKEEYSLTEKMKLGELGKSVPPDILIYLAVFSNPLP